MVDLAQRRSWPQGALLVLLPFALACGGAVTPGSEPSRTTGGTGAPAMGGAGDSVGGSGEGGGNLGGTSSPSGGAALTVGGSAGASATTLDPSCGRTLGEWTPPVSAVGLLHCKGIPHFSVVQQRGTSWVLITPRPTDFSDLHGFRDGTVTDYRLSQAVSGKLLRSPDAAPAAIAETRTTTERVTTLYRGLSDTVSLERLTTTGPIELQIGQSGLLWTTANYGSPDVSVFEGPSLEATPTSTTYASMTMATRPAASWEGTPVMLLRDEDQWFAVNVASKIPLGIRASYFDEDWLLSARQNLAVLTIPRPSNSPALLDAQGRLVAVVGTTPDDRTARLSQIYGSSVAEASAQASLSPLAPDYVPAPVIWLNGAEWHPEETGCSNAVWQPSCSEHTYGTPKVGLQTALSRLGRDRAGNPWLVAAVTTADAVEEGWKETQGELCSSCTGIRLYNVALELHLIRLTQPPLERKLPIIESFGEVRDVTLDVDGSRGTLTYQPTYASIAIWQIDLDGIE